MLFRCLITADEGITALVLVKFEITEILVILVSKIHILFQYSERVIIIFHKIRYFVEYGTVNWLIEQF